MPLDRRHFLQSSITLPWLVSRDLAASQEPPSGWPNSPFLSGNFFPVHKETEHAKLKVVGAIPAELDGLFVRNGPNPQFPPKGNYHWFDGDGMLHAVRLREGAATYRNRYVQTAGFETERKAGRALFGGILDKPDLKKVAAGESPFKNAANTSLVWHAGKLLAQWEGGEPHAIRVPTLETAGLHSFKGKLKHAWSAHPKVDPSSGEMIGYGYDIKPPFVSFSVVNAKGELVRTTPVDLKRPTMIHDFAITTNYLIFPEQPQTFDFKRAIAGQSPWYFDEKLPTRLGLIARKGETPARWFEAKPGFFFHTLSAHEDGDTVVLHACRFPRFPSELGFGDTPANKEPNKSVLYRWVMNLKRGTLTEGPIDDQATEFPRMNESRTGMKHRFGYCGEEGGDLFSAYRKFDLDKGTVIRHELGKGRTGGEAIFVPRSEATMEDDGWLITFVFDQANEKSELLILECQDFTAKPVARVLLPVRVPYGFHGTWIPGTELVSG